MEIIRLSSVSKKYSRLEGVRLITNRDFWMERESPHWFWALEHVNLSIPKGGTSLGVIGANGSGKSTLLRIIAGVTKPTYGTVVVHGRIVSLLELFAGMQPDLSGRENIILHGIILGMRRREIRRKFDAIAEFAGVEDFMDMPLKHYSTGMIMRLGFSVAIHVEADIILVDEAWSIGDIEFQNKSLQRLAQLREQGATLILVSHDMDVIRQQTQDVLWLQRGKVASCGPSDQVIRTYLDSVKAGKV